MFIDDNVLKQYKLQVKTENIQKEKEKETKKILCALQSEDDDSDSGDNLTITEIIALQKISNKTAPKFASPSIDANKESSTVYSGYAAQK